MYLWITITSCHIKLITEMYILLGLYTSILDTPCEMYTESTRLSFQIINKHASRNVITPIKVVNIQIYKKTNLCISKLFSNISSTLTD